MFAMVKRLLARPAPTAVDQRENSGRLRFVPASDIPPSVVAAIADDEGPTDDFAMEYGARSRHDPINFPSERIPAELLRQRYVEFCREWAFVPASETAFFRRVKSSGFERYREPTGARRWFYRFA